MRYLDFCFISSLKSLYVGYHFVNNLFHLWHILLNSFENDIGVNLKIMVGYAIRFMQMASMRIIPPGEVSSSFFLGIVFLALNHLQEWRNISIMVSSCLRKA